MREECMQIVEVALNIFWVYFWMQIEKEKLALLKN